MPNSECTRNCWIAGAVLGLLVWILTSGVGTMRWFEGLFLAIVAGALMGVFLLWALCSGRGASADPGADRNRARASAAGSGGGAGTTVSGGGSPAKATTPGAAQRGVTGAGVSSKPVAQPSSANAATASPKPGAAKGGTSKPAPSDTASSASEAATLSAPSTVAEGTTPAAAPASTDSEAGSEGGSAAAREGAVGDKAAAPGSTATASRTQRTDGSDNLKAIRGVGPKLERLLHDEGVTRFAQIASWSDPDIDHFAEKIGSMGGRIRSDDWVSQARTLDEGAEDDFSGRVDKDNDV